MQAARTIRNRPLATAATSEVWCVTASRCKVGRLTAHPRGERGSLAAREAERPQHRRARAIDVGAVEPVLDASPRADCGSV
jgi:hypothetical protein